jgi:hypothetical protein
MYVFLDSGNAMVVQIAKITAMNKLAIQPNVLATSSSVLMGSV